ncbi:MAG: CPBP family intramembrane metalloprotease [Deltaproteobacteria bacterium]|nr:MAG: CPBP family intramembrane metalloprotease [Deltaproteobacteria bacterium]
MEANKIEVKTLIISLATILSVEAATKVVIPHGLYRPMVSLGVVRLLEIILLILTVLIWGKGLSSIGLARSKLFFGLKKGMIWSAGFGMAAFFGFVVLFAAGVNPLTLIQAHLPTRHSEIALFFVIGGIVGPIAEEVFFRGILYGFFRRWGVVVALVLSTLIFVLIHPINHGVPITQVAGGIVFAVAYEVERSLITPITIHVLGNMTIFTLSLIS